MATPATTASSVALTNALRAEQAKRAQQVALAVAAYYKTQVDVDDTSSIQRWLALILPKILQGRTSSGKLGALYGDTLRRIEVPSARDSFRFDPADALLDASVVRSSIFATGITPVQTKMAEINKLDVSPVTKHALITKANHDAVTQLTGAVERHVQNGARQVVFDGIKRDKTALGYVRVTKADPCFFCAMLASRGLVYADDSFDESDPRFTGSGSAKVHDHCYCSLKPVYTREDELLEPSKKFFAQWQAAGTAADGVSQVIQFRRMYESRAA